jgi:hypothetical protein
MSNHIGLYYPYIHFKDDGWVKLTALYWDRMGRIVPKDYPVHDSDTVTELAEETGFVENVAPGPETITVGQGFADFVERRAAELRGRYGLHLREAWPVDPVTAARSPGRGDPQLAYVYHEKMWGDLGFQLFQSGLATNHREGDPPIGSACTRSWPTSTCRRSRTRWRGAEASTR